MISTYLGPLYLPVETSVRELDSKLLLAAAALTKGFIVLVGKKGPIKKNALLIGQGVYLHKSHMDSADIQYISELFEKGISITALDEEGLVQPSMEYYTRTRVGDGEIFKYLCRTFSWGEVQETWLKSIKKSNSTRIVITGNPRFDLLREPYRKIFSEKVKLIRDKFSDFILVNTNFSAGNFSSSYRVSYIEFMRSNGFLTRKSDEQYYVDNEMYYRSLFKEYVKAVKSISKSIPSLNIVIRPHPSEDNSTWLNEFRNYPNVHVESEGNVVNWILASMAVIHTGCTTGIEAFIANKLVLRYHPIYNDDFELPLPNSLGESYSSLELLIERLKLLISVNFEVKPDLDKDSQLKNYIANFDGEFAYERILDSIKKFAVQLPSSKFTNNVLVSIPFTKKITKSMVNLVRENENLFISFLSDSTYEKLSKQTKKFPGITQEKVELTLNRIYSVSEDLINPGYSIKQVDTDLFAIIPTLK